MWPCMLPALVHADTDEYDWDDPARHYMVIHVAATSVADQEQVYAAMLCASGDLTYSHGPPSTSIGWNPDPFTW